MKTHFNSGILMGSITLASVCCKMKVQVAQLCPTLCDPMDYTVPGILQARILEWVAFPFSRGFSQPRNQTRVSCIAGRFFTSWATRDKMCLQAPIPSMNLSLLTQMWKKWEFLLPELKLLACLISCVWLFVILWTVAHQAPLSLEFSRPEYWSG